MVFRRQKVKRLQGGIDEKFSSAGIERRRQFALVRMRGEATVSAGSVGRTIAEHALS